MGNVETLMAMMAAFNANDLDKAARDCHPDIVYTIRGHGPFGGTYQGVDAFFESLGRIKEATNNTMTVEPEVVVSDGDVLMLYARVHRSPPDGRTYDSHQAYLYRFFEGLLIEGQTIPVDQQAFDTFTSE